MRESEIEKKVTAYAKSKGWLSFKFVSPSNRGVPDRIYIRDGQVIFIEFKAPGKKPTKLQENRIKKIREQNIDVRVIDNDMDGMRVFDSYEN